MPHYVSRTYFTPLPLFSSSNPLPPKRRICATHDKSAECRRRDHRRHGFNGGGLPVGWDEGRIGIPCREMAVRSTSTRTLPDDEILRGARPAVGAAVFVLWFGTAFGAGDPGPGADKGDWWAYRAVRDVR